MDKIVVFDTSYGTLNLGDFIINESINREMADIFDGNFVIRYPTHTPLAHSYQFILKDNVVSRNCKEARHKFLAGTNLLKTNLRFRTPDWNINGHTSKLYAGSIALGCGVNGPGTAQNLYTKKIYKNVLSKEYVHSARDDQAKHFLEGLGYKAINTGCPTTWMLTPSHCKEIPTKKSKRVIFTLTDYRADYDCDQELIDTLLKNYEDVYFWIQGSEDYEYFKTFKNISDIQLINPSLEAFKAELQRGDVDYVGTRLHAGIYAMQHKVRSIIIVVDNRARDMQQSFNINAIERDKVSQLDNIINNPIITDVKINEAKIKEWKQQFADH